MCFWEALGFVIVAVGCSEEEDADTNAANTTSGTSGADTHTEDDHAHPSEGPHHGSLIEFGNEEYHGEFVARCGFDHDLHSRSGATEQVPVDAESITLNVIPDGEDPQQHELDAVADEGDPEGKSSRFVLADPAVVELLDAEGTTAKVSVMIEGISYQGDLAHDHEGHDHEHSHE